ncbi:MAG: hypothetical protein WAU07_02530 [Microgenomates group bacterium]
MNKLIVAALITSALIVSAPAQTVQAETEATQKQKLEQEIEIECEVGAYGQTSKCTAKAEQFGEQEQSIKFREGQVLGKTHSPADTALDAQTTATAALSMLSGVGALVIKRKLS